MQNKEDKNMSNIVHVCVPVGNIRREPKEMEFVYTHDELQETQALYNEKLILKKTETNWCYVTADEQKTFGKGKTWHGYPGWIRAENIIASKKVLTGKRLVIKSRVSKIFKEPAEKSQVLLNLLLGTRLFISDEVCNSKDFYKVLLVNGETGWIKKSDAFLKQEPCQERDLRQQIVSAARLFTGTPYLWGGRSIYVPEINTPTGVDCSGLVNLSYRTIDIDLPRDAKDQWLVSKDILPEEIKAGDLIFLSERNNPEMIVHVILYVGEGKVIEAYETKSLVREIEFFQRFGVKLSQLKDRVIKIDDRYIYFKRVI